MKRSIFSQIFMLLLMLIVGITIIVQIRTYSRAHIQTFRTDEEAILLSELVNANHDLRNEIASLEQQLAAYDQVSRRTVLEELVEEMNQVKVANGAIEVSGPGIELTIDGEISVLDLQDLLNELRNAGAEALALNGHRIVSHSVLNQAGQFTVDGNPISRPYTLQAIGDPDTLETAMLRSGSAADLLQRTMPNLTLSSVQQSRLVLPVFRSQMQFEYAQLVE
ncbi:MAG: DUF881 domain-containing protein [Anaerolineae bacterium]|nr:DUF881 domain-containing protein [Anaerolineae bacterium]